MSETQKMMDEAAEAAKATLPGHEHTLEVAVWLQKHYLKAGYKRLCKILIQEALSK